MKQFVLFAALLSLSLARAHRCTRIPPGGSDHGKGRRPRRSHRLLGFGGDRRLALAHGDAAQGRRRQHSDQCGSAQNRGCVGSGEGRSGRLAVQGLWCARRHADSRPPPHHVAGRQHAQDRNRRRYPDASVPFRRASGRARTTIVAGLLSGTLDSRRRRREVGWDFAAAANPPRSLEVVTTQLRPGYLRKNGVPYSDKTTLDGILRPLHGTGGQRLVHRHDDRH